jgi:glycosyltransferase involved in cell wall biosynthesis
MDDSGGLQVNTEPDETTPLVSIVIPARQAAATLGQTLESIEQQTYPHLEVIVVDNGSTDGTQEIARDHGCTLLEVAARERSGQLNAALAVARGKYWYRVDADFVLAPTVVEEAVRACKEQGLDGVLIHNVSDAARSRWARVRKFERDMYRDDDLNVAVRFVLTDLLREIGGHDEGLAGPEDYDLHRRVLQAGGRLGHVQATELHLGEPSSLWEVWTKHVYYGKAMVPYIRKHGLFALRQLSPARPAFARNWRRFKEEPANALLFAVYQFVKYAAGLVGIAAGALESRSRSRREPPQDARPGER